VAVAVGAGTPATRVIEYLLQKNRPYNAAILVPNLGGDISVSKMKKILEDGAKDGTFVEVGETAKVYFPNQDNVPECSAEELTRMQVQCHELEETFQTLVRHKEKQLAVITRLEDAPCDKALPELIKQMEQAIASATAEMERYKARAAGLIADKPLNVAELRAEVEFYTLSVKKMRDSCTALFKNASEHLNQAWKDIAEEAGLGLDG